MLTIMHDLNTRGHALSALLLLSTLVSSCHAFDANAVASVVAEAQRCRAHTNPAVAVTVVRDGNTVFARGFGVRNVKTDAKANGATRFNIASLSKAFTATLLLKVMEEDRRYNLSTKVRDILGEDFQFGDTWRTKEATVEDLLAHKMAIPANNRLRFNTNLTRENLKDRLKYLESPDGFRNVYIYSNLMYGLATYLTQIIGKGRWEELLRTHLFQPLGMSRSTFAKDLNFSDPTANVAQPYRTYNGTLKPVSPHLPYYWSELAGSGAVVSTADDMAKWLNFLLSEGQGPSGQAIMSRSTVGELFKARAAMPRTVASMFLQPDVPVSLTYEVYGMGMRRGYYRGYPILGHGGSSFGYRSLLTLIPSKKIGVFTTMSGGDSNYALRGTLHAYLMDQALGVQPWLNLTTLCSFPAPWHNVSSNELPYGAKRPLAHNISAYLGFYENPAYGTLEIKEWQDTGEDDGQEPQAHFTLFYGFATWDLVQMPAETSSSGTNSGESFYGKGRNFTAWVDYSPFVFHAPPEDSDVIVEISGPGLEKKVPPVFTRLGYRKPGTSSASALNGKSVGHVLLGVMVVLFYERVCWRKD